MLKGINKILPKMRLKAEIMMGIESQKCDLVLSKLPLFSPVHPISPFSQKAKQYFIDAVFVTPVILSKIPWPASKHCLVVAGLRDFVTCSCKLTKSTIYGWLNCLHPRKSLAWQAPISSRARTRVRPTGAVLMIFQDTTPPGRSPPPGRSDAEA